MIQRKTPFTGSARWVVTQAAVPLALIALLVVVGVLAWYARANERARSTTAHNALRDYAAFAAWQFGRQLRSHLGGHISMSIGPVRRRSYSTDAPPLRPSVFVENAHQCDCGFKSDMRFAFRLDPPYGALVLDTTLDAAMDRALRRIAPTLWSSDAGELGTDRMADMARSGWLRFDTLAGKPYAIAYTKVGGRGTSRVNVYGVVADMQHLEDDLRRIANEGPLLPPSLVGTKSNDAVLSLRVTDPNTGTIYETPAGDGAMAISASDTVEAWLGGLVTTVSLRPELARTLLIGGIPTSRLPWYLGLLALSTVVAGLAIVQWQRGRELARLRDRFVANVSHELRTPLTQISMLGETMLLERHRSAEESRRYLSVIVREARRLTHLVESVLRFSRAEATAPGLRIEPRDIVPDIRDTVDAFAPLAAAATTRVELSVPESAPSYADAGAVRQILLNLLDNAVKYGPPGQTARVAVNPSATEVQVSVEDEGPGIAPADRARVFEPFTRLDGSGRPNVTGAGIGLSVVKDLVRAHGGRVWIGEATRASARGTGTAVTFTLRPANGE